MSKVARVYCDVSCRVISVEFTEASNHFELDVLFITSFFDPFLATKPIPFTCVT